MKNAFNYPSILLLLMIISCNNVDESSSDQPNRQINGVVIPSQIIFTGEVDMTYSFSIEGDSILVEVSGANQFKDYSIHVIDKDNFSIGGKKVVESGKIAKFNDFVNPVYSSDGSIGFGSFGKPRIAFTKELISDRNIEEYIYDSITSNGDEIRAEQVLYFNEDENVVNFHFALYGDYRTEPLIFYLSDNLLDSAKTSIQKNGQLQPFVINRYKYEKDSRGRIVSVLINENGQKIIQCQISYD